MEAKELRVGNWVYSQEHKKNVLIKGIKDGILKSLTPINLTEEILLKCGFEKSNGRYYHDDLDYGLEKQGNDFAFCIWSEHNPATTTFIMHSEHLHTFQNNFYALSKKELEINL